MQETVVPPGSFRGAPVPWWFKILSKLILTRTPIPRAFWARFNIFRHSYSSEDPAQQVRYARDRVGKFMEARRRLPDTVLELGPGEITTIGVVYKALGIGRTIMVDVGDFGITETDSYRHVADAAAAAGLSPPDLQGAADRSEIFARCGVDYVVSGLEGLRSLPDNCVDFVTSVDTIEHMRLKELGPTFSELRRVMKEDGFAWHAIDFQDHIGGKLNNLRFSEAVWESSWMSGSGFYTNRMSASQIAALMKEAGFRVELESRAMWPQPRTDRGRIAQDLQSVWTDEDLRTCLAKMKAWPK